MTTCPMCGESRLLGLYASFWALVDENGEAVQQFSDLSSETEMTSSRMCLNCEHEFECE